jgi:amidohydrolase
MKKVARVRTKGVNDSKAEIKMTAETIKQLAEKYYPLGYSARCAIHRYPETAFQEFRTSKLVTDTLSEHGIANSVLAETGVAGLIKGGKPGRTVLLRADMDALELEESPSAPLRSERPGYMHACGHDGHTAGLLMTAIILNELKDELCGNVKLMFQPAEESVGGAKPMIDEGMLKDVDAAFAAHLWGEADFGEVWIKNGPVMAAPDEFRIRIKGKGGHAAHPQLTSDPIVMAANVINMFQQIISRRRDPVTPAVITVGSIHAGEVHNIIPSHADLVGTIRTFDREVRAMIISEMEKALSAVTSAWGSGYDLEILERYPAVLNDPAMADLARQAAAKIVGRDNVKDPGVPNMGGEDFAFVANAVASAYLFIGIKKGDEILHHNPDFGFDDTILKTYAALMAQTAVDYLAS